MIKLSSALIAQHVDDWTGDDTAEGAAVLEARVGAVVDASGMKPETIQHWRTTFLAPVIESLRSSSRGPGPGSHSPRALWRIRVKLASSVSRRRDHGRSRRLVGLVFRENPEPPKHGSDPLVVSLGRLGQLSRSTLPSS
ncbi:hypothetical protein [Streptomyces niveus]|uniref:hypothetical protein n=1 Tax=Streptomyces niveus TaxID=193462 RepID=UPI0036B0452D